VGVYEKAEKGFFHAQTLSTTFLQGIFFHIVYPFELCFSEYYEFHTNVTNHLKNTRTDSIHYPFLGHKKYDG